MDKGSQFKKKKAVVFDLDGTLAQKFDESDKHKKRFEEWAKKAEAAPQIKKNVKKFKKDEKKGDKMIVLTARNDAYRPETEDWLKKNHIKADDLLMRPKHDTEGSDANTKSDILESQVLPKYKVKKAYDDKGKNVKMFRKHGIKAKKV
jgi:uncharacterized HAD superfamily protein